MKLKRPITKTTKAKHEKTERKAAHTEKRTPVAVMDSRSGKDRRAGDRRQQNMPVGVERRKLERRTKVSRRRQIDPTTCERDYTCDEIEFMAALDDYKRRSGRMFPTCSEVLEVLRGLGYEKQAATEAATVKSDNTVR